MILGIDAGNHSTKVCGPHGVLKFLSDLGEYRDRRLMQVHGPDDMVYQHQGKRGFAGTLARAESEFSGSMQGITKAHGDMLIRVLLAIHRYGGDDRYRIVVGQPIEAHTEPEKLKIISMLTGKHTIAINGLEKTFTIEQAKVAAEGGASFWATPIDGLVHQLDIGSGTVNWATLEGRRYIDKDSFTLLFGGSNNKTYDLEAMTRAVIARAAKWGKHDKVLIVGGKAEEIYPFVIEYFPEAEILRPVIKVGNNTEVVHPVYANAVGNYNIARSIFGG